MADDEATATEPRGRGRPKKVLTPEQVEQVEKLAAVLTQEQIADFLGIGERTLRNRLSDDPEIAASYARGRARAVSSVGTSLLQQAYGGNIRAMEFYLKTQGGWSEKQTHEFTGASDFARMICDAVGEANQRTAPNDAE